MRLLISLSVLILTCSCIPLKVAPNLVEGKVLKSKKWVKHLGPHYVYAFNDPKKANEFYRYINAKFQTRYDDAQGNTPILVEGNTFYLTFYEKEKHTEVLNLITPLIGVAMEEKGYGNYFQDTEVYREGTWYIVITVTDENYQDSLHPEYEHQDVVLSYVEDLRKEYLTTKEYIEVYLKSK